MKKPGCSGAAAFLIVFLVMVIIGTNEAVGFYFENCDEEEIFDCLMEEMMEEQEELEDGTVTAVGTYEHKGYAVTISANIPLKGGAVTGTVSGACEGEVKGFYDGQQNGVISGKMTGTCDPFIVKLPAGATFNGTVNRTGRNVPFSFEGSCAGKTRNDSLTLVWSAEE